MSNPISRRSLFAGGAALAAGLSAAPPSRAAGGAKRIVVVWSEGTAPKNIYPNNVNSAIAEGLAPLRGWDIRTASLNDPDQGLPDALLTSASALIWWGHAKHDQVKDELVQRIVQRVKGDGMGFIGTHSAHWSKPFKALMGTSGSWLGGYVEDGSKLDMLIKAPAHPIMRGLKDFVVPHTERYTQPFETPTPDEILADGLYTRPDGSTEHSVQALTWTRDRGRVFYFQPGHESYPIYFQAEIRHIFRNAVPWVARTK